MIARSEYFDDDAQDAPQKKPPLSAFERASLYAKKTPPAISGQEGHDRTFALTMALLHGFLLSEKDVLSILQKWNKECVPPWSDKELLHKIKSAALTSPTEGRGWLLGDSYRPGRTLYINRQRAKPRGNIDPSTAIENYLNGTRTTEASLRKASPARPNDDWRHDTILMLAALYAPEERVNIVTDYLVDEDGKASPTGYGATLTRAEWVLRIAAHGPPEDKAGAWFRMNPLDGKGIGDSNVTSFRFALLECDKIPVELQLSLYAKLPLPIAAIYTSGGRSIHALIKVDADCADEYRSTVKRMLELLSRFGADTKNKNPSRLSRLPGAQRIIGAEGDGMQRLLYLNQYPEQRRIIET